jgi:hypothetical protein
VGSKALPNAPNRDIRRNYDTAPDGQRFLMLNAVGSDATTAPPQIVVFQHFDEELKRPPADNVGCRGCGTSVGRRF